MSRTNPKKSKGYDIGGTKYSYDFADGKIIGIRKSDENGQFGNSLENEYLNPRLSTFGDVAANKLALEAYNLAKHGSNTDAYEKALEQLSSGSGNVIRQTEMLKELGSKTKKDLREKSGLRSLAERAEEEESFPESSSEDHDRLGEAQIQ